VLHLIRTQVSSRVFTLTPLPQSKNRFPADDGGVNPGPRQTECFKIRWRSPLDATTHKVLRVEPSWVMFCLFTSQFHFPKGTAMSLEIGLCDPWLETRESDVPPPEGVTLNYSERLQECDGATLNLVCGLVITLVVGIPASMAAAWLYDHLVKHGAKRITIDREQVTVNRGEIQRIVREKIEIRQ